MNPVSAIDWNKEHRRNTGMGPNDIGGWLKELYAIDNPLRREFHLLTLLSGSRPTALKKIRLEHVDLQQRLIHIPKPKGGEENAFDIPLSQPMIRCIIAIRLGRIMYSAQAKSWLFPADSEAVGQRFAAELSHARASGRCFGTRRPPFDEPLLA